jgi:competence protein ComEA
MVKKTALPLLLALSLVMFLAASTCFAEKEKAASDGKVDINTASVEELAQLKGVGKALGNRIIDYRKANGPFQKPEDITKVKGIGPAILEKNKEKIKVSSPPPKAQ